MEADNRVSNGPVAPGMENASAPQPIDPLTGQHKDHWVLSEEERSKGFIRPLRAKYIHNKCGIVTRMGLAIAETYARDPKFYGMTFCIGCKSYLPVDQFRWDDASNQVLGS